MARSGNWLTPKLGGGPKGHARKAAVYRMSALMEPVKKGSDGAMKISKMTKKKSAGK